MQLRRILERDHSFKQQRLDIIINKSAADIFNVSTQDIINKHILTLDRSITLQKAIETAMGGIY